MAPNKDRLYVALYPSGTVTVAAEQRRFDTGPIDSVASTDRQPSSTDNRFHWALLLGPKVEGSKPAKGMRYHIKNPLARGWVFEERELRDIRTTPNLLVRIMIGKVKSRSRLAKVLRKVPLVEGQADWRCRNWVAEAVAALKADGKALGTAVLDWGEIERVAEQYAGEKIRAGRFTDVSQLFEPKPTWDMLQGKETIA
ncbi:hypothetical protein HIM_07347 [Hirsutella minnesotensis 3608]|uniref:Uncharacterized protein n=1 Tax=Hirsutella minnesotensis 3608 TaxID=1043627 RepID=A0A0F7ZTL9_9HYPO|nr:hypothetical protein HIM_07347 [Hirsutella minnesotensis 3608]